MFYSAFTVIHFSSKPHGLMRESAHNLTMKILQHPVKKEWSLKTSLPLIVDNGRQEFGDAR